MQELEAILVPETDDKVNPAGVKGIGEIGIFGTAAAIASAVYHATNIRVRHTPIHVEELLPQARRPADRAAETAQSA